MRVHVWLSHSAQQASAWGIIWGAEGKAQLKPTSGPLSIHFYRNYLKDLTKPDLCRAKPGVNSGFP